MADIDIGSPAINRDGYTTNGYTYVLKENPANDSGFIHTVQIFAHSACSNFQVAIFSNIGNNLTTRDNVLIGAVSGGIKQTFTGLHLAVVVGDYIGFYCVGTVERSGAGVGYWYKAGDKIPCSNTPFTGITYRNISLYGIGATVVLGRSRGFIVG